MTETKPAVRLRVWHRHGPDACGGVMFICLHRFTSEPTVVLSEFFEWPSGRVMREGAIMVCDACGTPIGIDTEILEDMKDAGAYPTLSHEVGGRVYDAYSGDLDDDLTLPELDEEGSP